jgi:hypothetical protein
MDAYRTQRFDCSGSVILEMNLLKDWRGLFKFSEYFYSFAIISPLHLNKLDFPLPRIYNLQSLVKIYSVVQEKNRKLQKFTDSQMDGQIIDRQQVIKKTNLCFQLR